MLQFGLLVEPDPALGVSYFSEAIKIQFGSLKLSSSFRPIFICTLMTSDFMTKITEPLYLIPIIRQIIQMANIIISFLCTF